MALILVITRTDKPNEVKAIPLDRKLIVGHSLYCDVVLEDKTVANMQCEIQPVKSGHIVVKNLDGKKEVLLNQVKLRKSAIKADDVLKIGPFILRIDPRELTPEETALLNAEYEEFV
jgi:pSer/pThr/pTyr-binding forkhead associated (FHA) protein